ncbi:MAG: Coenzyme F420 hydrogenase/dehydrogenase, beta subunit C-terminal domain [Thermoplasmatota archaeon]
MTYKVLKIKDGDITKSINEMFKEILKSGKVKALLIPQEVPSKKMVFHVLVSNPEKLNADIITPVLASSTATIVSHMTKIKQANKPIAVVMRPCQIRALLELVKLNQANLENIVIIGVDCLGTIPIKLFSDFQKNKTPTHFLIDSFKKKNNEMDNYMRTSCLVCKEPVPNNADVTIGLFGVDIEKEILVESHTDTGKKLLEDLKLETISKEGHVREKAVKEIIEEKNKKHTDFIKQKSAIKGIEALTKFFDKCINCHNCMKVCPICYCKECLFESTVFDAEAYKFLRKAENKGLFKMPTDTVLFHLGRMNHMILSCVECGLCSQACPVDIPLMEIFIPVADNAQKEFNYHPGKDPKEKIPMIVYREDEYKEVGEA